MDERHRDPAGPAAYRIRVRGHLDDRWTASFDGLTVTREPGGDTVLSVRVADQAALHGLLRTLRDLGAPLISINPVGLCLPAASPTEELEP
jgi:hypothetical protein